MHKRHTKKEIDRQTNRREAAEQDSDASSEEGGYFYNLRQLLVYIRRTVRHQEPQPDTPSNLRAVAASAHTAVACRFVLARH